MSRIKEIDFKRVTISVPGSLLDDLKIETKRGDVSSFIAEAIRYKLDEKKISQTESMVEILRKFRETAKPKTTKNSIEFIRELRYGGKY